MSWDTYHNRLTLHGTSRRDIAIEKAKAAYRRTVQASPDLETIVINETEYPALIISTVEADTKTICSMPDDSFHSGDIISWDHSYWIINETDTDQTLYTRGKMLECNYVLRWLDSSGDIIERHCRAEDSTKYTLGIRSEDHLLLPDSRIVIQLPYDPDTCLLREGKRFLIDQQIKEPSAYEITNTDRVSRIIGSHGVLLITCKSSQFSRERDNAQMMIADYYTPAGSPGNTPAPAQTILCTESDGIHTLTVTDPDGTAAIIIGRRKTLCFHLYTGVQAMDSPIVCALESSAGMARIISNSDEQAVLQAEQNIKNIGKAVTLVVSAAGLTCRAELKIKGVL